MVSYDWWANALKGKVGPIHDGHPQPGFYRRKRGPTYTGVAIFEDSGMIVAKSGNDYVDPENEWLWVAKSPVSEDAYRAWESTGRWPDEPNPRDLAHNQATDREAIDDQIETVLTNLDRHLDIDSENAAAVAQSIRSRLLELSRKANEYRVEEKAPHLAEEKLIEAAWRPLITKSKFGADQLAQALENYFDTVEGDHRVKGTYGRSAMVQKVSVPKLIDPAAAYHHYYNHDILLAAVCECAKADVKKGATNIPGFDIIKRTKVK